MNDRKTQLVFGALLHDVGKVVYRGTSESGTHSELGARFVEESLAANDTADKGMLSSLLEQIRFHHADPLSRSSVELDSLAYITYFADNISAGMDRKDEGEDSGFDKDIKLRKIFNILNGHDDDNVVEHKEYSELCKDIKDDLSKICFNENGVGSLLNSLEEKCSAIPSSTNKAERPDVSLFDHVKTTAAIAACLYDWLEAEGITNFKKALFNFEDSDKYYENKIFLLWSCDLSGIQDFIYQISGTEALKQLRARSFYLDMLLEDIVDELMDRLELTRCNVLYTGGGHAYALLPNTEATKNKLDSFCAKLKEWLLKYFGVDLYCANAFVECSAYDLENKTEALFKNLGEELSKAKANRYTADDIRKLNFEEQDDYDHTCECSECHRSDKGDKGIVTGDFVNGKCPTCAAFSCISSELVDDDVFVVSEEEVAPNGLALPFEKYLSTYKAKNYKESPQVVRVYTKNWRSTDIDRATRLWMGDYTAEQHDEAEQQDKGISYYASHGVTLPRDGDNSLGIERLGVLRGDVDDLGSFFSSGFADKASISRTATLSRCLSYFFKYKVNEILEARRYAVQIIYSGGDDMFIVGNWSDVIYAAQDIRKALDEFTGNGVLTMSAGLGMYSKTYPIARMATEVGELEGVAKSQSGKNALTLWQDKNVFGWDTFESKVYTKFSEIQQVFESGVFADAEKGKAFIYQILVLLRNTEDKIAIPRLAYLLARSFEDKKVDDVEIGKKFFEWANDDSERQYFEVALEWYVYSVRERG